MKTTDIKTGMICEGDYIIDRMGGDVRQISSFTIYDDNDAAVNFTDGGVMGVDEIKSGDIRLESEVTG